MKTISHTQTIKMDLGKSEQDFIQIIMQSENNYNNLWLDQGKSFLAEFYDVDNEYYQVFNNSRSFWKWWLFEFRSLVALFMYHAQHGPYECKEKHFVEFMGFKMTCPFLEQKFSKQCHPMVLKHGINGK